MQPRKITDLDLSGAYGRGASATIVGYSGEDDQGFQRLTIDFYSDNEEESPVEESEEEEAQVARVAPRPKRGCNCPARRAVRSCERIRRRSRDGGRRKSRDRVPRQRRFSGPEKERSVRHLGKLDLSELVAETRRRSEAPERLADASKSCCCCNKGATSPVDRDDDMEFQVTVTKRQIKAIQKALDIVKKYNEEERLRSTPSRTPVATPAPESAPRPPPPPPQSAPAPGSAVVAPTNPTPQRRPDVPPNLMMSQARPDVPPNLMMSQARPGGPPQPRPPMMPPPPGRPMPVAGRPMVGGIRPPMGPPRPMIRR